MLRLRHRHAVARHDDDGTGILHDEGRIVRRALLHRARFDRTARCSRRIRAEAAENDAEERPVHALAHDVAEDRARRTDQRARDDEREVAEREADTGRRPARIGVQHRHDDGHVRAADPHDQVKADDEGEDGDREEELDRLVRRIHHDVGNTADDREGKACVDDVAPGQHDRCTRHVPVQFRKGDD